MNIDIDIDMAILENIDIDIDIDKGILQNIDIDKISYRLGFGISNTPRGQRRGVALGGIEAIPATKTRHGLAKSFPAFLFDG